MMIITTINKHIMITMITLIMVIMMMEGNVRVRDGVWSRVAARSPTHHPPPTHFHPHHHPPTIPLPTIFLIISIIIIILFDSLCDHAPL